MRESMLRRINKIFFLALLSALLLLIGGAERL